ncbi:MAG: CPBP family intramembrane metalloprotease [Chloroflexaceae bacterium]|nr:CPBP family intramembrane metalloprotease [Chloroflexaceae bacterium]
MSSDPAPLSATASPNETTIPLLLATGYLAALTTAELLTTFVDAQLGLLSHAILLTLLILLAARWWHHPMHRMLLCMIFGPLIRIISLSLPLAPFDFIYWLLITSIPLFATAVMGIRLLELTADNVGWNLGRGRHGLLREGAIALTGVPLGYLEYSILQPEPIIPQVSLVYIVVPFLIILISTGLMEELVFRGIMQHTVNEVLGKTASIVLVALIFAVLHIGYKSLIDFAFVLTVGLLYGWFVSRTGSILGVTISHGLINTMLFVILPALNQVILF